MSRDSHRTQITVAGIGLIGVLGAAVIANWDKIFPGRPAEQSGRSAGGRQTPKGIAPGGQNLQGSGTSGCFQQYFSPVPQDRIATLEAGVRDHPLIEPHQAKDQTIALQLEETGQPVGAVKLHFYPQNEIFKIESIVDSTCQLVEDYVNATRGGDKHVVQNWDDVQVRLGNATYTLALEYGQGRIDADFLRVSPGR